MKTTAPSRRCLGSQSASAASSGSVMLKVMPSSRAAAACHIAMASVPPPSHALAGSSVVPQATAGRANGSGTSKSRSSSVMQNAMKIPGLASALNFIGVSGGSADVGGIGTAASASGVGAGSSTSVAAAGGSGSAVGLMPDGLPAVPEGLYDAAAAAVVAVPASSNGHASVYGPQSQTPSGIVGVSDVGDGLVANGHAVNGRTAAAGGTITAIGVDGGHSLAELDPVTVRVENNILPYQSGSPSLAAQIRDIASTLRHINSLRVEYMERIAEQEMELAARDQTLRAKDERIQSLEMDAAEARRSMGQLQKVNEALETELRRLRADAAAVTAAASAAAAALSAPPPPLASPLSVGVANPAGPAAAATAPAITPSQATAAMAPPPPPQQQPLTAPPAAVAAAAPAVAAPTHGAQESSPTAPAAPVAPPPPPPPRVPEILVSYRSSWSQAYLHFNVEGRGWTDPPGHKMEHSATKEYTLRVPGRSLEFVVTNGAGEWDSPGGGPGRNYRIDSPGEYRLHYGTITQTKPWQP